MAIEERHLEIGLKAAEAKVGFEGGEKSLSIALDKNPDNPETILAMARLKTKFTPVPEGKPLYERAMRLLIGPRPQEAVEVYKEFYRKYLAGVEPQLQYRLAAVMERSFDMDSASRAYEMIIHDPGVSPETRQKALYQAATLLDKMGHHEAATGLFRQFVSEFPDAPAAHKFRVKLGLPEPETVQPPLREEGAAPPPKPEPVIATPAQPPPLPSQKAIDNPSCPACQGSMVRKRANGGPHAGKLFWVCTTWPQCRKVLPAEG
jgi:hypothetical protein